MQLTATQEVSTPETTTCGFTNFEYLITLFSVYMVSQFFDIGLLFAFVMLYIIVFIAKIYVRNTSECVEIPYGMPFQLTTKTSTPQAAPGMAENTISLPPVHQ